MNLPAHQLDVVIVATEEYGLNAFGKVKGDEFFPIFSEALRGYGVNVHTFRSSSSFLAAKERYGKCLLVLVFNESCILTPGSYQELVGVIDAARDRSETLRICNLPESGILMGDKRRMNEQLTAAGVAMPRIASRETGELIFSNSSVGSGADVSVGTTCDPSKYNTDYIDTVQAFEDKQYYLSIRAMAIGETLTTTIIRARNIEEGSASVHTSNTPADPRLLNFLYAKVVMPRMRSIVDTCHRAGARLGLGFYAHDLLPPRGSSDVMLCESGFKFDDYSPRDYMGHISADLIANDYMNPGIARRYAAVLLAQIL
ncbi:MAG: hypothetical protein ABW173_11730 [Sphingomonas sp.]